MHAALYLRDYVKKTCPPPKLIYQTPPLPWLFAEARSRDGGGRGPAANNFAVASRCRCCPCEPGQAAVRMVLEERPNMEREDVGGNTTAEGF